MNELLANYKTEHIEHNAWRSFRSSDVPDEPLTQLRTAAVHYWHCADGKDVHTDVSSHPCKMLQIPSASVEPTMLLPLATAFHDLTLTGARSAGADAKHPLGGVSG